MSASNNDSSPHGHSSQPVGSSGVGKGVKPWAAPSASLMVIPHSSIQPVNPSSSEPGLTLTLQ